jgi:cyclohexanone monooxygenase
MKSPKWEDWNWEYQKDENRFKYLGNGLSSEEKRPGGDLSYYIRNHDDTPVDKALKVKL